MIKNLEIMNVKTLFKEDFSSENIIEQSPKVQTYLNTYFEGVPLSLVRYLLREFDKKLEHSSILTAK